MKTIADARNELKKQLTLTKRVYDGLHAAQALCEIYDPNCDRCPIAFCCTKFLNGYPWHWNWEVNDGEDG